ncbi:MAG: hypothetical protein GX758_00845 [Tenericutes bacterium]|nr:hypothetical protein [Mycoplasmatota bacterium]
MRKIFKLIVSLLLLLCVKINALTYSQWSEDYPKRVNEILIEKEERYKWFIKKDINEEYLIKESFGDKYIDYSDYKYTPLSEKSMVYPEIYEDRIIYEETISLSFSEDDVTHVIINNLDSENLYISEISVFNLSTETPMSYTLDSNYIKSELLNFVNDGNVREYKKIPKRTDIVLSLNGKYNYKDIYVLVNYKEEQIFRLSYKLSSEKDSSLYTLYNHIYVTRGCSNICVARFDYEKLTETLDFETTYYTFKDKLYRTYDLAKEYKEGYYTFVDGYTKDDMLSKTFYRYITDEYIIVDDKGNIVTNNDYCVKNICFIVYIDQEDEENLIQVDIPQTYDPFFKNILLLFTICIFLIIIYLKKIKKMS